MILLKSLKVKIIAFAVLIITFISFQNFTTQLTSDQVILSTHRLHSNSSEFTITVDFIRQNGDQNLFLLESDFVVKNGIIKNFITLLPNKYKFIVSPLNLKTPHKIDLTFSKKRFSTIPIKTNSLSYKLCSCTKSRT